MKAQNKVKVVQNGEGRVKVTERSEIMLNERSGPVVRTPVVTWVPGKQGMQPSRCLQPPSLVEANIQLDAVMAG